MNYTNQSTVYLSDLNLASMLGRPFEVHPNTTLNEKLNHLVKETPPNDDYPTLKYWCIGIGGQGMLVEPNAYPYSPHMPWDACLFNMIPFVMRTKDNDLDYSQKLRYRLRVEKIVNGQSYFCYYLKVFDQKSEIEYKSEYSQIAHRGDLNTIDPLNLDEKDPLNPKPVTKIGKIIGTSTSYMVKKAKMTFNLTLAELEEIRNIIDLLYPDQTNAGRQYKISEIGVCFGKDKVVGNITEAIQAQIGYHIGPDLDLLIHLNSKTSLSRSYEFGLMEPLYAQ